MVYSLKGGSEVLHTTLHLNYLRFEMKAQRGKMI